MGSFLTDKSTFQALILPDSRFTEWASESTASADGGRAEVASTSAMQVETVALGTGAPAQSVRLTATRSGLAAPTDGNQAGAFTAEHLTDGVEYGLDECYQLTGVSRAFDTAIHGSIAMATTSLGKLVIASTEVTASKVAVFTQDQDDLRPNQTAAYASAALRSTDGYPAVYAYGDGLARVLYVDQYLAGDAAITVGVATVDGTTVSRDGTDVLGDGLQRKASSPTKIGEVNAVTKLAAAARGEEVLLVMAVDYHSTTTYRSNALSTLRQYASTDGGLSFRFIGELADTSNEDVGADPVVRATDAGFEVYYSGWTGASVGCYRRAIGSAYTPLSSALAITMPFTTLGSISAAGLLTLTNRLAMWTDHRGYLFSITQEDNLDRSTNSGLDWQYIGAWADQKSLDHVVAWSAAYHRGHAVIAIDRAKRGAGADYDPSLLSLGGWTNYTYPAGTSGERDYERPQWSQVYVPCGGLQRITNCSVTASSIAQSLGDGVNTFTSSAAEGRADVDFNIGIIGSTRGAALEASGTVDVNKTALADANVQYPLTYDLDLVDGISTRYGLRVLHQHNELKLYERTGASTFSLQATVAVTTDRVDVRIFIENGKGRAYYRTQTTSSSRGTPDLRRWVPFTAAITLTNAHDASAPANSSAHIFTRMASGDSSDLHYVAIRGDGLVDYNLTPSITGTDHSLRGAEYSYAPLYVADDITVQAVGGSVKAGDEHTISAAYDYGAAQALTADPRRGFKESSSASGSLQLAYEISTSNGTDVVVPGGALAVALIGANFSKYTVQTYSSGAWADVVNVDTRIAVSWLSDGQTIRPDPANNTAGPLVRESEFNGARFVEDTTATDAGFTIDATVGGVWTEDNYPPQLHLSGAAAAASGTNGAIIPRDSAVIFKAATGIRGVRIVVAADEREHAGGQLEIGRVVIGRVLPHGTDYSWGRVVTVESGSQTTTLRDRTTRRVVDAQPRRIVEVAWADGLMTRGASTDDDTPDYYSLFNATLAQAGRNTTAWEIYGILQALNGGSPVVYVPRIERQTSASSTTLSRRDELVYGRLQGDARWEVVVGEEGVSEVVRGLGFSIEELI